MRIDLNYDYLCLTNEFDMSPLIASAHRRGNKYSVLVENLKGREILKVLCVDWIVTLM